MTGRELGWIGETLLGRPGVLLMVVLWSFGVGCAVLPLKLGKPLRYSLPAFGVAAVLAVLPPTLLWVFACTMVATLVVMVPALWLVSPEDAKNKRRAAGLLVASGVLLAVGPLLPEHLSWLAIPLGPVLLFGIPVGLLLLLQRPLRAHAWLPAAVSSVAFTAAWLVWMARDHYYRLAR